MQIQYSIDDDGLQASPIVAQYLSQQLTTFVQPLLAWLDAVLDLQLVQTFLATLHIMLEFRHRNNGLVPSRVRSLPDLPRPSPSRHQTAE